LHVGCRIWRKPADVARRPELVTPAGRRPYRVGAAAECTVGLTVLAALRAIVMDALRAGFIRAMPKQSVRQPCRNQALVPEVLERVALDQRAHPGTSGDVKPGPSPFLAECLTFCARATNDSSTVEQLPIPGRSASEPGNELGLGSQCRGFLCCWSPGRPSHWGIPPVLLGRKPLGPPSTRTPADHRRNLLL